MTLIGFKKKLDSLMDDAGLLLSFDEYEEFIEYIKNEWINK